MELDIPSGKAIVTHQIFVIYLDQAKLEASGLCVGVMYWTGYVSCLKLILSRSTSYDIDFKSWDDYVLRCEV
jgi:hypothetical protein